MNSPQKLRISAKKIRESKSRICQGDVFSNIQILEDVEVKGSKILVKNLFFPYIICLNQECDLENDYNLTQSRSNPSDSHFLHLAIAPAFNFDQFLSGSHWGEIFATSNTGKRGDTRIQLIIKNEIPRFHYLKFPDSDMPELIIDFKHFFTVNRDFLYNNIDSRICSIDDLFKEKISQRFSYFISRIGLPEVEVENATGN